MTALDARVLMEVLLERFADTVASLATSGGRRESLAQLDDLFFLHAVESLRRQGHSSKVVADLFGYSSLASLRRRLRKIRDGRLAAPPSLRRAILARVADQRVSRHDLLADLETRDVSIVRGLLRDLVDQGVLRETDNQLELARATLEHPLSDDALENIMHVLLGDRSMALQELEESLGVTRERVTLAAARLSERGVVVQVNERLSLGTDWNMFPAKREHQALTSFLHHFRGACLAILGTLRKWDEHKEASPLEPPAVITATFEVTNGDPIRQELLSAHQRFAAEIVELYARYEERKPTQPPTDRITIYAGTAVDVI